MPASNIGDIHTVSYFRFPLFYCGSVVVAAAIKVVWLNEHATSSTTASCDVLSCRSPKTSEKRVAVARGKLTSCGRRRTQRGAARMQIYTWETRHVAVQWKHNTTLQSGRAREFGSRTVLRACVQLCSRASASNVCSILQTQPTDGQQPIQKYRCVNRTKQWITDNGERITRTRKSKAQVLFGTEILIEAMTAWSCIRELWRLKNVQPCSTILKHAPKPVVIEDQSQISSRLFGLFTTFKDLSWGQTFIACAWWLKKGWQSEFNDRKFELLQGSCVVRRSIQSRDQQSVLIFPSTLQRRRD